MRVVFPDNKMTLYLLIHVSHQIGNNVHFSHTFKELNIAVDIYADRALLKKQIMNLTDDQVNQCFQEKSIQVFKKVVELILSRIYTENPDKKEAFLTVLQQEMRKEKDQEIQDIELHDEEILQKIKKEIEEKSYGK